MMQRCILKHFSKFAETGVHARAWLSTLERTCRQRIYAQAGFSSLERTANMGKSTGCMKFTLDGRSTSAQAWDTSPRSSVHSLARADCKHMQSTGYTHFPLERTAWTQGVRSSVEFRARAWVQILEFPDWTFKLKINFQSINFDPLGLIFWKTL